MTLKIRKFLMISMASLLVPACGAVQEESSDAAITLLSKKVYLLPGTSTSCKSIADGLAAGSAPSADITGKYFSLKNLVFTWNGDTNFNIAYVKVSFSSTFIQISDVIFAEDQLAPAAGVAAGGAGYTYNPSLYNGGVIAPSTSLTLQCPLKIGGISIPTELNQEFQINAKVTLVGFYTSGTTEIPTSTSQEFTLINTKE